MFMQQFELFLRNEKIKQYNVFAVWIILANLALFISLAAGSGAPVRNPVIFAVLMVAAGFTAELIARKRQKKVNARGTAFLVIIVTWLLLRSWWPAAIMLILGLLYGLSQRKLPVIVGKEHIVFPSFPKRVITWDELSNVKLKDGLLTLDFKNNRLAQALIEVGGPGKEVAEREFNEFCREQLSAPPHTGR
jgi:hypothetical protein